MPCLTLIERTKLTQNSHTWQGSFQNLKPLCLGEFFVFFGPTSGNAPWEGTQAPRTVWNKPHLFSMGKNNRALTFRWSRFQVEQTGICGDIHSLQEQSTQPRKEKKGCFSLVRDTTKNGFHVQLHSKFSVCPSFLVPD